MAAATIVIITLVAQIPGSVRPESALDKLKLESAKRKRCNPEPLTAENRGQMFAEYLGRMQEATAKFPHKKEFRDRGEVYVTYGPPDNVDTVGTLERWSYDCLDGKRVVVEFTDQDGSGDYRMSPLARQELHEYPRAHLGAGELPLDESRMFYSHSSGAEATVEIRRDGTVEISLPLELEARRHAITASIVAEDGIKEFGKVDTFVSCEDLSAACRGAFRTLWPSLLPPNAYILSAVVEDAQNTARSRTYVVNFSVATAAR